MKRIFVWFLLALAVGVGFVTLLEQDPGYVLIAVGRTTVEMTLWIGIAIVVAAFIGLYVLLRVVLGGRRLPRRVGGWLDGRNLRLSHSRISRGMIAFIEGRWEQARKVLVKAAARSDSPLLYYLMAARASQALGDDRSVEKYLRLAEQSTSGSELAVGLTQAELQVAKGQLEQALATLVRVRAVSAGHPVALKLQMQVYEGLEDYEQLRQLLPELRHATVLDETGQRELARRVYRQLLLRRAQGDDAVASLQSLWQQMPRELQDDAVLAESYARALIAAGDEHRAERFLRRFLGKQFDDRLVHLYGVVRGEDPHEQLLVAETWLPQRNNNAELMLCLGRLSLLNQLWGKAREYFEASSRLAHLPEAYAELGRLLARLGERERSIDCFQRGLIYSTHGLPELPLPAAKGARRAS